ncbi:hypothetical protein B566_EDAN017948 [Ephemera danica]|nr:hypothetical protein B566_EDAN017948 [Ephemera danica]
MCNRNSGARASFFNYQLTAIFKAGFCFLTTYVFLLIIYNHFCYDSSGFLIRGMRALALLLQFGSHPFSTMASDAKTFLYFAYGSNLLQQRLHINNPSAQRVTHAKLKGYRLEFAGFSRRWGGSVATIEPSEGGEMWGALYRLDKSNLASLDRQEGVHSGVYSVLNVTVTTEDDEPLECRTYKYNHREPLSGGSYSKLPESRRPSPLYLQTIQRGAEESGLPMDYRDLLNTIPSNDHDAGITLDQFLAQSALVNKEY